MTNNQQQNLGGMLTPRSGLSMLEKKGSRNLVLSGWHGQVFLAMVLPENTYSNPKTGVSMPSETII
jgi:hypothetical protein